MDEHILSLILGML